MKRIFDFTFGVTGFILLIPFLVFIYILIRIKMPDGSPIFKQTRVGKAGNLFIMYKFRSMSVGHKGNSISVAGESRITPIGKFIRKYKIDELPALYNVIIGDMSLVGPRPDVPGYADTLVGEDRKILCLRPGITGPASIKYSNEEEILATKDDPVKYNNEVIYPDKVKINLHYYYNRNIYGDLKIIINTVFRTNY